MLSHKNLRDKKTCFKMPNIQQINTKNKKLKLKFTPKKKL